LQRDSAIETFLVRTINHPLTAAANFLQQFIIAKVAEDVCPPRNGLAVASCPRSFLSIHYQHAIIAVGIIRLRRSSLRSRFGGVGGYGGRVDLGCKIIIDQSKAGS